MTRAIFIDRDGTINIDKDYISDPDKLEFIEGSPEAVAMANRLGLKVVVVSNQTGVAKGMLTIEQVNNVNAKLVSMLAERGAHVDAVYFCPHHPDYAEKVRCECRKPGIGMITRAQKEFGLDLTASFVIGDKWSDVKCGENAGTMTSLVRTGYGEADYPRCIADGIKIDYLAENLFDALEHFVREKIEAAH